MNIFYSAFFPESAVWDNVQIRLLETESDGGACIHLKTDCSLSFVCLSSLRRQVSCQTVAWPIDDLLLVSLYSFSLLTASMGGSLTFCIA